MVRARSGEFGRRIQVKGSYSNKENIFEQEELAMDPIDVEPLRYAPPTSLVPYGMSKDEVRITDAPGLKESSMIESQNAESLNLGDNPIQNPLETLVPDIEREEDPSEDSPIEKHDS